MKIEYGKWWLGIKTERVRIKYARLIYCGFDWIRYYKDDFLFVKTFKLPGPTLYIGPFMFGIRKR